MCLAVPMRITAIDDGMATIEPAGLAQRASLMLVPEAVVGDYVLVHAGFAITVLDAERRPNESGSSPSSSRQKTSRLGARMSDSGDVADGLESLSDPRAASTGRRAITARPGGTGASERVSALARALRAAAAERGPATFMEVCGTHTMAIARYGLRELLPAACASSPAPAARCA